MNFLDLNLIPNASSKDKERKVLYFFEILSFLSGLYQKKPPPSREKKYR